MKVLGSVANCAYDGSVTKALVDANQENTGFLAAILRDSNVNEPRPNVGLTGVAATDLAVYGAVMTINTGSERCGVATSGIVPFVKDGAAASGDIGGGVIGVDGSSDTTKLGKVAALANKGTGVVVAYYNPTGATDGILYVDLDRQAAETA